MRIKIALRNITRHRLRSILTTFMIGSAVCSIILFHGLTHYFLESLKTIASESQFGNMQIARENLWSPGKEERKERMFNMALLDKTMKMHPEVIQTSGRLSFYGLVSNGDLSISGRAIGIDSEKEPGVVRAIRILNGKFFKPKESEVIIGAMLAEQMGVKPGDDVTVLTNTVDGVMNALDMKVAGIFTSGLDEIDSQVIYMPLSIAQSIIDTVDVDLAVLKFSDLKLAEKNLDKINVNLKTNLSGEKVPLRARSWKDLAVLYRQCEKFYKVQNRLIETILLALMFLGILNAVSMTVVERTGEIGTLRAIGESAQVIVRQFVLESLLLSLGGVIIGTISAFIFIQVLEMANVLTEIPGATTPIRIRVHFLFSAVGYAGLLAFVTTLIATLIPARSVARMNIVDALRKNV